MFEILKQIIEYYKNNNKPLHEAMGVDLSHITMINDYSTQNVRRLLDFLATEKPKSENFELPNDLKIAALYEGQLISALEWKCSTISSVENLVTLIDVLIMAFNQYLVFCPVIPKDFATPYIIELSKAFAYLKEPFNKEIKQKLNPTLVKDKDYKAKIETCLQYFEQYYNLCKNAEQENNLSAYLSQKGTANE